KAHLFDPPPVIRSVNQAIVDYYLNRGADKVMIEILDGKGQVVRTFDSSVTAGSKQPQDSADEETPAPATVRAPTTRTGANHFVWDLRYPGPVYFLVLFFAALPPKLVLKSLQAS